MAVISDKSSTLLKERILKKPKEHLDVIYDLLPDARDHAEIILHLVSELIKEKKIQRYTAYKLMEEPIYFQENNFHEFTKRDPLIGRIAQAGGLKLFNYYLNFKYGTSLSTELLQRNDIFLFKLPPFLKYFDKDKWLVHASARDKQSLHHKYYATYDMTYELLGDALLADDKEIVNRLIECEFDFNTELTMRHLKQYLYVNHDKSFQLSEATLNQLLTHGLSSDIFTDFILKCLWDEFSMPTLHKISRDLLHIASFMMDRGANLKRYPKDFTHKLLQTLKQHEAKSTQIDTASLFYLTGQIIEATESLEAAIKYYKIAGEKGLLHIQKQSRQLIVIPEHPDKK